MTRTMLLTAAAVASSAPSAAQTARQRTYANPIDIDYRYNFEQQNQGISYRSGADPVIVVQRGEYYLFETIGDGYWRSTDLGTWQHITPTRWPLTDIVAPAALSVRDTIYLLPSTTSPLPILMLTDPASGRVEFYNRLLPWLPMARAREADVLAKPDSVQPGPWDPAFFHDPDTERWFLYWNSSNAYPLHVIELDKSRHLAYRGTPKWLFGLEPDLHGWERFGRDHRDTTIHPFIEGAWMTKQAGRYYLQYGAPGTEYNVYATGVYVADDPLGPFTYAPYNPVAYKPGGFVQGAGHGNTFQDVHGNWWSTGTPWIGVNWNFERRIGLHPAGFDSSGQMYVDTRFGDFPHWLPTKAWRVSEDLFTGWMLLSYRKPATASSALDSFPAGHVTDENPRTFWVASQNRPGEWLTIDLGRAFDLKAIQVNYADYKSGLYGTDSAVVTQFRLQSSVDGRQWQTIADLARETRDRPNAYIELATPVRARFVRYEHIHVGAANLAISDIRVFGNGLGARPRPPAPAGLSARRDRDERNAVITWRPARGAVGYNVRWGISPAKLYQTYQRFADQGTTLELRALTVGQAYWAAIESFDENGVSTLSAPVPIVLRDTMTTRAPFGHLPDGRAVELFTLTNRHGVEVRVMTYGGIITVVRTPDRTGQLDDIVLGFDSLAGYLEDSPYFGAIVGRYANRIENGRFTLDGTTYRLARNNGPNTLHGGVRGFDKVLWSGEPFQGDSGVGVTLRYTSKDGEEGFPGTLFTRVTYTLTPGDELIVDYEATSDKATPVNLSQHTYWNLHGTAGGAGGAGGDILDHVLTLDAAAFTPVDSTLIPTGEIAAVAGTPFDFRAATKVGARIAQENPQLRVGHGYDHNWVLDRTRPGLEHAARLAEPTSGRTVDISTTEPGVQFYSGNFLDGTIKGKGGRVYAHRSGLCLETQHFPDSPNHPGFPSTILRPDATYRSRTVFAFGVEEPYPHATEPISIVRQIYDGALTPELAVNTFRNIDRLFPTRRVPHASSPLPLPPAATQLHSVRFSDRGKRYDLETYLELNRVTALLVLKNGRIALERYRLGNTQRTRWMSMSVAKSITSTLIGAALKQGYIASLSDSVTRYVPALAGSAYDGVSVRDVLMMASGVRWTETYTDPRSDRRRLLEAQISQVPGSAMAIMRSLPRAAEPGTVNNYSTGETQVAAEILRSAVRQPLATYLSDRIWSRVGMEADANWWLDSPDGVEIGGSGFSATLRDYGRFGLFLLNGGIAGGEAILPDGWIREATSPKTLRGGVSSDYGYLWWPGQGGAYAAEGIYGQWIYINPAAHVVIVVWSAQAKPEGAAIIDDWAFFAAVARAR